MKQFLLASLLYVFSAFAAHAETGVSADAILIGQSVVLSGPQAENGSQYTKGIKLYFDHVNAQGGVHGRKLELATLDDAYVPSRAEENTRVLIEDKQVFALFGYAGTGATLASLPLAERTQTPFIAPYTGAHALRAKVSPVLYHLRASYFDEMSKIVEYQSIVGMNKVAVIYQDDNFGREAYKSFEAAMEQRKLKPVAVAAINASTFEAREPVQALIRAEPNAVVLATAGKASSSVLREFAAQGKRPQFFGLSVVSASQLRSEAKEASTGIIISQVVPPLSGNKFAMVRQYRELLGDKVGEAHHASLEGYMAARVLVEALRRAGKDLTRTRLLAAFDGLRKYDLGDFFIDFSNGQHMGSNFVDLSIVRANGQFTQ
ncbi:ABC transporter substrate-binding protein [Melaminivora sp.]|jgi:ABC-type branched-subunit amino acid transport system substrate-binding protein